MWSCKSMWHCKYSVIRESKVKFNELYMKMSKYENSVSIFCTFYCKPYCMEAERHKCYFMSFLRLVTETITPKRIFFFKITRQMLSKLTKSMRNCQHPILWGNDQNWNLSFRNFLLKYETPIKDNKKYTQFFLFLCFKKNFAKSFFINF